MKNSHKKAKRSNFLIAAELVQHGQEVNQWDKIEVGARHLSCSKWCCNALDNLDAAYELDLFKAYFDPGVKEGFGGGWWDMRECEARLLALLLCAEMLRR